MVNVFSPAGLFLLFSFTAGPHPTIYHPTKEPLGQIFWLGDIVRLAGGNFTALSINGGVVSVSIQWKCDLDFDFYTYCLPKYIFRMLGKRERVLSEIEQSICQDVTY